ncbi:MAG TPA: GxxExxY protein [Spirochaetota bacterium]|nr:GxxExxY protein [Spirochaetota bacterium]
MRNKIIESVIKAGFRVQHELGCGFLEKVYQNALALELGSRGLKTEQEQKITVYYHKQLVGVYYADLLIEDEIIVEVKCGLRINMKHIKQVQNYLKATAKSYGLIVSFADYFSFKPVFGR